MLNDVEGLGFVPNRLPPDLSRAALLNETFEPLIKAERSLSQLQGAASRLENPHLLIGPFIRREARFSSAIENTYASAEQMALFDLDPTSIRAESRSEVREVSNYVRALEYGLSGALPISQRLILNLHEILLRDLERRAGIPGQFRTTQNAIGRPGVSFTQARYVPPPPRFLSECLDDWERFQHADSELPRLVRFAMSHYQFEAIHPFDDGNGRIGRLLIVLQLCDQAQLTQPLVYVSGFFEQHRSDYYDALYQVSTKGAWIPWVRFFLTAISTQAQDAYERANRLTKLRADFYRRIREKRASALLPKIVDALFAAPSLTVASVSELTGLSPQAAGALVNKLVEKGIIVEGTGRKKHRVYFAPELLQVIDA